MRGGHERDPTTDEAASDAEIEALVGTLEPRVDAAEQIPDGPAHEQTPDVGTERVLRTVVLPLVEAPVDEADAAPEPGHRDPEGDDRVGSIPRDELRRRGGDRGLNLERSREQMQRVRIGGRVLGQQPDGVGIAETHARHPHGTRVSGAPGSLDHGLDTGGGREFGHPRRDATTDHECQGIRAPVPRSYRAEGALEVPDRLVVRAIDAHDQKSMNTGWHDSVSLGARCRVARVNAPRASDRATLQLAALALREPAPDAEALVVGQGIVQALPANLARRAHTLGVPRGAALLREEGLRVRLRTQRICLPRQGIFVFDRPSNSRNPQINRVDEPVVGNAGTIFRTRHFVSHLLVPPHTQSRRTNYTVVIRSRSSAAS
jgi:hypothetical protein